MHATPGKILGTRGKSAGGDSGGILDELTSKAASLDEVDLAGADRLIAERLGTIRPGIPRR
jgi:hypothetical protein